MKIQFIMLTALFIIPLSATAQQKSEEQCKKNVDTTISTIEFASKQKGIEQKLKDLSINDIRKIEKAKGSCIAMQEINKRTMD